MPRIGDQSPDLEAVTRKGNVKLSGFAKGKWIGMYSYTVDFTPACTKKINGFVIRKPIFETPNAKLPDLGIDRIYTDLGWGSRVKKNAGVYFDFPIIADIVNSLKFNFWMQIVHYRHSLFF